MNKLRTVISGLAVGGCLVLAVVKGQLAWQIWEARGAGKASIQGLGTLLLLVAAVLLLRRIRAGAVLGMMASVSYQSRLMLSLSHGAHSLMTYVVLHLIVLWLNAAAWKFMGSRGQSNETPS